MESGIKKPLDIDDWVEHELGTNILEKLKVKCKKCKKILYLGSSNLVQENINLNHYSEWRIICPYCNKAKLYWTKESIKKIIAWRL